MKLLKDMLTGIDGGTYDIARVGLLVGIISYIGATGYTLYKGTAFDWLNFGTGFAALLGAGGLGIGLKAKTEPGGCTDVANNTVGK